MFVIDQRNEKCVHSVSPFLMLNTIKPLFWLSMQNKERSVETVAKLRFWSELPLRDQCPGCGSGGMIIDLSAAL
jgi:hypothetical protein